MSGPKRAPGHYRPRRGSKYFTGANPDAQLYLSFLASLYLILKYVAGCQWMDRLGAAMWSSIKYFPLWN